MSFGKYQSIFSVASTQQRKDNFDNYCTFTQQHDGELFEQDKDLTNKRQKLKYFKNNQVKLKTPLKDLEAFYHNYVKMQDNPKNIDQITLMLTCIYKFAHHEWAGIKSAWDVMPDITNSHAIEDKISRIHLVAEFCFNQLLAEEPEVRACVKALLDEITIDEIAHVGQMIKDSIAFDFNYTPEYMLKRSWIPSYLH